MGVIYTVFFVETNIGLLELNWLNILRGRAEVHMKKSK